MLITNGKIDRNIDPKRFEAYKAKGYVEVKSKDEKSKGDKSKDEK